MTELGSVIVTERERAYTTVGMTASIGGVALKPNAMIETRAGGMLTTPRADGYVHRWPCKVFRLEIPAGTEALLRTHRQLIVRRAFVVAEVDSKAALGPQATEILEMAGRLKDITPDEQTALANLTSSMQYDATMRALRMYAEAEGRDNSIAVMGAMLIGGHIESGAHRAACAAALAVAYRDLLLTEEEIGLYDYMYEPWRTVMESPYF